MLLHLDAADDAIDDVKVNRGAGLVVLPNLICLGGSNGNPFTLLCLDAADDAIDDVKVQVWLSFQTLSTWGVQVVPP